MSKKKIIIGVLMAAIFVMMAFVPVTDNFSSGAFDKSTVAASHSTPLNKYPTRHVPGSLTLDKYHGNVNVMEKKMNINMVFSVNYSSAKQVIIEKGHFGTVTVFSSGSRIYLNMSIIRQNNAHVPGDCVGTYYKYPQNHEAVLVVMKIPVIETSDFTKARIVAFFGEVVSTAIGDAVGDASAAAAAGALAAFGAVAAALAVDFVAVYLYALANHDPTFYFDTGTSWGTAWYNFYQVGVYGEEGAFTGTAQSHSSGIYVPLAIAGGNGASYNSILAMFPHSSVWNPFDEPLW
ncbi:MAG TPA: hypothetical protein HA269_01950 [Ferroplasma sp.]|nr:hypothetical protein [Ferroplasma sp.]